MTRTDTERMIEQERRLVFARFDLSTAWDLGTRLRDTAQSRGLALAIEVRLARETVFLSLMPGATPQNIDWARRKRNMVELRQRSSYAVGQESEESGKDVIARMGLPLRDFAVAGGGFPILVEGVGCVGAVIVSGLPQRDDHALVVEILAEMCGVPLRDIALD